jgi:hypothetical protein
MPANNWLVSQDRTPWLLVIGQHLKSEYDAVAPPVPTALAALVEELESSAKAGEDGDLQSSAPRAARA